MFACLAFVLQVFVQNDFPMRAPHLLTCVKDILELIGFIFVDLGQVLEIQPATMGTETGILSCNVGVRVWNKSRSTTEGRLP